MLATYTKRSKNENKSSIHMNFPWVFFFKWLGICAWMNIKLVNVLVYDLRPFDPRQNWIECLKRKKSCHFHFILLLEPFQRTMTIVYKIVLYKHQKYHISIIIYVSSREQKNPSFSHTWLFTHFSLSKITNYSAFLSYRVYILNHKWIELNDLTKKMVEK